MLSIQHISPEQMLFLDVETVPQCASYEQLPEAWKQHWDYKAAQLSKAEQEPAEMYQRAGIYAEFGKIICISVGCLQQENGAQQLFLRSFYGHDEKALLSAFAEVVNKWSKRSQYLCGHNIREFDVPYICRRMLVNNLRLPELLDLAGAKPWEVRHLDTLQYWKFGDYKHFTSLKLLAQLFGVPSPKDDIDGSMVAHTYYVEGNLNRIAQYCEKDVVTVVRLVQAMRGELPIADEQLVHKN
jgi:predicted PolB exonuclease-like 3'-5' exonuclease